MGALRVKRLVHVFVPHRILDVLWNGSFAFSLILHIDVLVLLQTVNSLDLPGSRDNISLVAAGTETPRSVRLPRAVEVLICSISLRQISGNHGRCILL